jgi:RluA family pseudouridine synthase
MTLNFRISHSSRLIDAIIDRVDPSYSARFIKRCLEANVCRVNGRIERFASALVKRGDCIELRSDWASIQMKQAPFSILFENDDILVIDKPAGAVCTDAFFQKAFKGSYLAHRLDKETTGVLLFGKSQRAALQLQGLFKQRAVKKEYIALVDGAVLHEKGVIESYLVKKGSFHGQSIWGSSQKGEFSKTYWERLSTNCQASLLQCQPETGRTHQIRVHLAEMGHPILIDRQYAKTFRASLFASRPLLHARRLSFIWNEQPIEIVSPMPSDLIEACQKLKLCSDF